MRFQASLAPLAAALLGACSWWMAGRPVEFAARDLNFDHALHVEEMEMACEECHGEVAEAEDLTASFLPTEDLCMDCHLREDDCTWCHNDPENRGPTPPRVTPVIAYSHRSHMEQGAECTNCHADATAATELPLEALDMDTCLACHNHDVEYAQGRCQHCHPSMERLPLTAVAELTHTAGWLEQHGTMARSAGASCTQCHSQTMCTDCHTAVSAALPSTLRPEAVELGLPHRGDFLTIHALEARANPDTCLSCHATSTCQDCHDMSSVSGGVADPFVRHPQGWIDGPAPNHGTEARLRIETCATCHDQGAASNCVTCHSVGRVGGNPHPPGWGDSHEREDTRNDPMCRICHVPGS